MSNNFVQQGLTMSPREIRSELLWIRGQMYITHDKIFRTLDFLVNQESISQDDIKRTRKDKDTAAIDLINTLKDRGTEISHEYYRKLAKHVQQENVNAIEFMEDLLTQISDIRMRIDTLESSLNIEKE